MLAIDDALDTKLILEDIPGVKAADTHLCGAELLQNPVIFNAVNVVKVGLAAATWTMKVTPQLSAKHDIFILKKLNTVEEIQK